jgi:hypothetical protein
MPRDYLPREEAKLVTWTGEFVTTLTPLVAGTGFPITADRLAEYVTTRNRFVSAYNVANNPGTRTKPSITEKNDRKKALIRSTRSMVDVLQAWPQMTNTLRDSLGISQRGKKPTPSPIPAQPFVKVESINGREVTISIQQSSKTKGKPSKVEGANIMVAYGELPTTVTGWSFAQTTGKSKTTIVLDAVDEATTAYITAFWFNGRKATGPAANPVSVNLGATTALPVGMKIKKAA